MVRDKKPFLSQLFMLYKVKQQQSSQSVFAKMYTQIIYSLLSLTFVVSYPAKLIQKASLGPVFSASGIRNIGQTCGRGKIINYDGSCVEAVLEESVYFYQAPQNTIAKSLPPVLPKPKIERHVVFVRAPDLVHTEEPIVVPPTQRQTVVYVLSKNQEKSQQVVQVPKVRHPAPEVFYINYNDGENPELPGGVTLQEALSTADLQPGQAVQEPILLSSRDFLENLDTVETLAEKPIIIAAEDLDATSEEGPIIAKGLAGPFLLANNNFR